MHLLRLAHPQVSLRTIPPNNTGSTNLPFPFISPIILVHANSSTCRYLDRCGNTENPCYSTNSERYFLWCQRNSGKLSDLLGQTDEVCCHLWWKGSGAGIRYQLHQDSNSRTKILLDVLFSPLRLVTFVVVVVLLFHFGDKWYTYVVHACEYEGMSVNMSAYGHTWGWQTGTLGIFLHGSPAYCLNKAPHWIRGLFFLWGWLVSELLGYICFHSPVSWAQPVLLQASQGH